MKAFLLFMFLFSCPGLSSMCRADELPSVVVDGAKSDQKVVVFSYHAYYDWMLFNTVRVGSGQPRSCDHTQIVILKDTAKTEALDRCNEAGAKNCQVVGSSILFNGVAKTAKEYHLLGHEPPSGVFGSVWAGCVVRGSATGLL